MTKVNMNNVGSEVAVNSQAKITDLREEMKRAELTKFLNTEGGRSWFWDLFGPSHANVFGSPGGNSATNTVFYALGKRDLGLEIWGLIEEANLDAVFKMRKENSDG